MAPSLPPPKMEPKTMEELLHLCTKEAPFRSPDGKLFLQIDGVAMGSPLGPLFANFYMGHMEENILRKMVNPPTTYCRYVDDVFVVVQDEQQLRMMKETFEANSVLKFTYEMSVRNRIPFLDIDVTLNNGTYTTTVYRKETNMGKCMNAKSECPDRYKTSVVNSYIRRAFKNCSTWQLFHQEIERAKQMLINNGYSNSEVETSIKNFLNRKFDNKKETQKHTTEYKLFYKVF